MFDSFCGLLSNSRYTDYGQMSALIRAVELADTAIKEYPEPGAVAGELAVASILAITALIIRGTPSLNFNERGEVTLLEGEKDGRPYRMYLRLQVPADEYLAAVVDGEEWVSRLLLHDGYGPTPGEHMDGFRYRAALTGLLAQLEKWATQVVRDDDAEPEPEALIASVREMQVRAADLEQISEVMEA